MNLYEYEQLNTVSAYKLHSSSSFRHCIACLRAQLQFVSTNAIGWRRLIRSRKKNAKKPTIPNSREFGSLYSVCVPVANKSARIREQGWEKKNRERVSQNLITKLFQKSQPWWYHEWQNASGTHRRPQPHVQLKSFQKGTHHFFLLEYVYKWVGELAAAMKSNEEYVDSMAKQFAYSMKMKSH